MKTFCADRDIFRPPTRQGQRLVSKKGWKLPYDQSCITCFISNTILITPVGPPKMSFVMPGLTVTEQAGNALSIACLFKDIILPAPTTKWTKIGGK